MRDLIEICRIHEIESYVFNDAYLFKPKLKWWNFLQKWAWNFLKTTKALESHWDKKFRYERELISYDTVYDKLLKSFFESFPTYKPERVLIGPEEYEEILSDKRALDIIHPFKFNTEIRWCDYRNESFSVLSLPVYIIPHMKGVLII